MDRRKAKSGLPLQLLVAGTVVIAMMLTASLLLYQGKRGAERVLISAGADAASQLANTIDEQVGRLLEPAEVAMRLLSHEPMTSAPDMDARLERLPVAFEMLDANPVISAFYMGYPDGEFLLTRTLWDPAMHERFRAPVTSAYMVQLILRDDLGEMRGEWLFYDASRRLLEHREQPGYRYDPRDRPWYIEAAQGDGTIITQPYVFFTTREVGITLARTSATGRAVVGMDTALADLGPEMARLRLTPGTESAIVSPGGRVLAYPEMSRLLRFDGDNPRLIHLEEIGVNSLLHVFTSAPPIGTVISFVSEGRQWHGIRLPLSSFPGSGTHILLTIPSDELLARAREIALRQGLLAALLVLLFLPVGWLIGRRLGRPLRALADQVDALAAFDYQRPIGVDSSIREARELSDALGTMSGTITHFLDITLSLSRETRLEKMLDMVLERMVRAFRVDGGAIYLYDEETDLFRQTVRQGEFSVERLPMAQQFRLETEEWRDNDTDLAHNVSRNLSPTGGLYTQALRRRDGELQGFLVLTSPRTDDGARRHDPPFRRFVEELSGAAAVAIETRQMMEAQERLLDAVIRLLADAIDAKSPYTSGHCERVPVLATLLMEKVASTRSGPLADFDLSEEEMAEFRMAAWLHDCGKITSPEHVVDKATKLETLYNRIHEIRTRFEVLLRDARIEYWQGVARGEDESVLIDHLQARELQLQEDYALVARANLGGESLDDETLAQLARIGAQTWQRHFDNRLGLSREEFERMARRWPDTLPVEERLLQDRQDHKVHWDRLPPVRKDDPRNLWGFDMELPEYAYDFGELHNLSIGRGTLTDEERFHVNDHIVQTIIMLNSLPLPRHLRRLPEIAANHHEKLDGTGYPRHLSEKELSIPARVVSIADVFEALTAGDRPYKKGKTLSESLDIMAQMVRDRHLDADLFELFLREGVHMAYANRFLPPDQITDVDIEHYLSLCRRDA